MGKTVSFIRSIYKKVCLAYASEPDENGESPISRLKKERSVIGKKGQDELRRPISEAEMRFLKYDCAFISAERSAENGGTEESNLANTKLLRNDLEELKEKGLLNFYDSEGEYQEIGSSTIQHESGFFCTDVGPKVASSFFTEIYKLSEKYNQDSFLFKSAGGRLTRTGFLIATNDAARAEYKEGYWKAGELYIDLPPEEYWTESESAFGDKRVFFRRVKPTQEELDYRHRQNKK